MSQGLRGHLRNNVVGYIALFFSLGLGTAWAAGLEKNSVGAKQIKTDGVRAAEIKASSVRAAEIKDGAVGPTDVADESLTGGDVQNGSLGGGDIGDGSLGTVDLLDGSVTGRDVQDGSLGSSDVQGLTGDDVQPQTFLGGTVTVQFEQAASDLASGQSVSITAFCPEGQTAIGGGVRGDANDSELTKVTNTRPAIGPSTEPPTDNGSFSGWRGTVVNENNGTGIRPEVWVICAAVPPQG